MNHIKEIKLIPVVCGMSGDSKDVKYDVKLVFYNDEIEKFVAMEYILNQIQNIISILHEDILDQIRK